MSLIIWIQGCNVVWINWIIMACYIKLLMFRTYWKNQYYLDFVWFIINFSVQTQYSLSFALRGKNLNHRGSERNNRGSQSQLLQNGNVKYHVFINLWCCIFLEDSKRGFRDFIFFLEMSQYDVNQFCAYIPVRMWKFIAESNYTLNEANYLVFYKAPRSSKYYCFSLHYFWDCRSLIDEVLLPSLIWLQKYQY